MKRQLHCAWDEKTGGGRKGNWRRRRARLLARAVGDRGIEALEPRVMLTASSPFGAAVFTPLPGTPTIIAGPGGTQGQPLLDLNGDGTGDMIVQYSGVSGITPYRDVSALLMNADGTGTEYRIARYDSPDLIDQVVVTDLNHDGHMDVVIMHTDSAGETVIDIFMGQTNGTFTQPNPSINLGTLATTPTLTVFDATGDHIPDLYLQEGSLNITVYPGNGDGTFGTPATSSFTFLEPHAIFQTDVTGDGIPDLVVSAEFLNFTSDTFVGGIEVYKGTSTGAYVTTPVFTDFTDDLTLLSVQTLSSSTRPDIVAYSAPFESFDAPSQVMVFKNNGNGSFTKDFTSGTLTNGFDSALGSTQPFLTPDLNKDGKDDMILLDGPGVTVSAPLTVHVELNNGNGFTDIQDFTVPGFSSNSPVFVADVDGDGFPDLIVGQSGSEMATVFFNNGSGGFVTPGVALSPTDTFGATQFRVLDLDNNGKMDVVFTTFPTVGPNDANVFMNLTGRTFSADIITPQPDTLLLEPDTNTGTPADPALDYNGDGDPDFLGYASNGPSIGPSEGFTVLTSSGTGGFLSLSPMITFGATVTVPEDPTPGDINNDGKIDLVFAAPADGEDNSPGIYVVMNGSAAPMSSAATASADATDLGIITSPAAFDEFSTATQPGSESFFKFTLSSAEHVRISIAPDAGDIESMLVSGSSGFESALVGLAPVGPEGPFFEEWQLPAGTYTLEVDHGQGADTHYRLDIAFPPESQEITVLQGLNALASDQDTPIDFGSVETTTTDTQKFFTVRNDGLSTLTFLGMQLPGGFSAGEDALPATLAPGASATFSVQMNVNATGAFGGNVVILSDDPNTPSFDLPVAGTVTGTPLTPGILVKEGTLTITSGQGTPIAFPVAGQNATNPSLTFTVKNTGNGTLTLGPVGFSLPAFYQGADTLVSSLAPGASDTFSVNLITVLTGAFAANISIQSDAANSPFLIPVVGTVSSSAPTAVITGDGVSIVNNATSTSVLNGTNFASANQGGAATIETFTITNDGLSALTVSHAQASGGFSVVMAPAASVAALGTTTIRVSLPTGMTGNFSGTVSFNTNDTGNKMVSFAVSGTVISSAPSIGSVESNSPVALGTTLTLTAEDVLAIAPATIKTVRFYADTAATGVLNLKKDKVLGTAKLVAGTHDYSLEIDAAALAAGEQHIFVVATDSKNREASARGQVDILPYNAPTIGSATVTPGTVERGQKLTVTAVNVADVGDAISQVAFYLGVPGDDGDFNKGADTLLGTGKLTSAATHTYTLSAAVRLSLALGTYPVYAVATSKHGGTVVADANDLTVSDVPPVIKSMTVSPAKIAPDNDVTVKISGVKDADGTVAAVNVYWSPSGATDSTSGAVLLGQAHLVKGVWTFTGKVPAADDANHPFPTSGNVVFLAQAQDNSDVLGNIVSAKATAVAQLAISGSLTITPSPIVHGQAAVISVNGVGGSPKAVEFVMEAGSVSLLGGGTPITLGDAMKKSAGVWSLTDKKTADIAPGDYTIFANEIDASGNLSEPVAETVTVM